VSKWLAWRISEGGMMGLQTGDQRQLFYLFNLEERGHLLRRINPIVMRALVELRENAPRSRTSPGLNHSLDIVNNCRSIEVWRR
jgi:hypothetical protein